MAEVLYLSAGGSHDRRVGDGGAVVTADGACTAGGDADDEQLAVRGEDHGDDGDKDAEGAPAGAGGKGQSAAAS